MKLKGKNVLITSGGTREYIDDVRVITNISSGALGAKIAEEFYREGCRIHYVHGKQSVVPKPEEGISKSARLTNHQIVTAHDLQENMKALIKAFKIDIVVHSAAVSDFTFNQDKPIKLSSSDELAFIEYMKEAIKPTPKIIKKIKGWLPGIFLVGFKFTVGKSLPEMKELALKMDYCDLVIANDKEEINREKEHIAYIMNKDITQLCAGKYRIAKELVRILKGTPEKI